MERLQKEKVVVSLTSFPGAIDYVAGAVKSLLRGRVLPDRIVLYLTFEQFEGKSLPEELVALERENEIFEIRDYPDEIRSYRKLIPALRDFPDATIITVDDDVSYHPDMVASLLRMHKRFPEHVIAHRAKRLYTDRPYKKWRKYRWYHFLFRRLYKRFDTVPTGVGGVLYPPGALCPEMLDESLFRAMAPTCDDIWFWAAAVANGRKVIPVPFGYNKPRGLGKPKELSLKTVNFKTGQDRNTEALKRVLEHYPAIRERLAEESEGDGD